MNQYKVIINKQKNKLYVKKGNKVLEEIICSTGSGINQRVYHHLDNKIITYSGDTPNGTYKIKEIIYSKDLGWLGDPIGQKRPYGHYIFALDNNPYGIAIHGTDEPEKLGSPVTNGCVRVSNNDIKKLKEKYVKIGTLVEIMGGK